MKIKVCKQFRFQGILISRWNRTTALILLGVPATCTSFFLFIIKTTPVIILKVYSKQLVSEFSHKKKNEIFFKNPSQRFALLICC